MVIKEIARIVLKTKKGQTFEINDKHIVSLSTSASCSSGGGIPAGCCNAGTMSLSFKQQGTGIVEADLFQASLTLYVQHPPHAESVRGVYNVTNSNLRYGIFDVSASDNIGLLDDAAYSAKDTENAVCGLLGIIGSGTMRYPAHILAEICNSYGVPHLTQAENAAIIPESTANLLLTSVSSECSTESIKDFANYLAEYIGGFITAYEDGRVGFGRIGKSEYTETLDEKNIQKGSFQKSPFSVWPTIWKVNFDSGYNNYWYTTGDTPDGYAPLSIEINNNPFWQYLEDSMPSGLVGGKVSDMIKYMWDYIVSIRNYINPFSATVYVPHLFKLGEIVHIKKPGDDSASREFTSCITDVTWTYRGGQQISCAGSDTRLLSCSASRTSAKKAEDYAKTLYRKKSSGGTGTNDTYTKAEIDSKDAAVKAIADKAQSTATSAATAASNAQSTADSAKSTASSAAAAAADAQNVNKTQDGKITELQKTAHTHSNKDILDKIEKPFTTADQTKLNSLENYTHPTHKANSKGFYKFASDGLGHVSETEAVTKKDIVGLGIPGSNTTYTLKRNGNRSVLEGSDGSKTVAITSDYVTHGYENSSNVEPYRCYLIFYHRKPDDDNEMIPLLASSEEIWVNEDHSGIGVKGTITAGSFSGANATAEEQGLMSPEDKAKLDGMDLSKYLPKDGTAEKAKAMSNGTLRSGFYVNAAANATSGYVWFRMATCKISGSYETVNTTFLITNGMGWHALLSCGIRNNGTGKAVESCSLKISARNGTGIAPGMFRVVAINSDTGVRYELWGQITARWQGVRYTVLDERNISGGKYNNWALENHSDADAKTAPASGNMHVDSSDSSVCATAAKATEATAITETAWTAVPATGAAETVYNSLKYLKSGNMIFVQGAIGFKAGLNTPTCGTMPSGCLPDIELCFTGWDYASGVPAAYPIKLGKDGVITLLNPTSTAYWFKAGRLYHFNFSYHIN